MKIRFRKKRDGVKYYNGYFDDLFVNGVYDDGSFNIGKYNKGEKLYWNKLSGKWVGKKNKLFKSNKVRWYEFENLNEKLIVKWFSDESNWIKGFKYIDEVGYFVSYLYKKSYIIKELKDDDEFGINEKGIYIDERKLKEILGVNIKEIIRKLVELNIIKVFLLKVNKYNSNKYLKSYMVNYDYLGEIVDRKWNENLRIEKNVLRSSIEFGDEIENIKKIDFNISNIRLNKICELKYNNKVERYRKEISWGKKFNGKEKLRLKKEFINKGGDNYKLSIKRRYKVYKDIIEDIKEGIINEGLFYKDSHSGRSYNVINGMDKEFRNEIKVDGESIVELDMSSCYVSCLFYFIERMNLMRFIGMNEYKDKLNENIEWFKVSNNKSERKENKKVRGIDWDDGKKDIWKGYGDSLSEYEKLWDDRKWFWCLDNELDIEYYDLGKCDFKLKDFDKNVNNEKEYNEFIDEFYKVVNYVNLWGKNKKGEYYSLGKVNDKYNIRKNRIEINENWLGFIRSDNLIYYCLEILERRWMRSEFNKEIKSRIRYGFSIRGEYVEVSEGHENFNIYNNLIVRIDKGYDWDEGIKNYREYCEYIKEMDGVFNIKIDRIENINKGKGYSFRENKNKVDGKDYFEYIIDKGKYNVKLNEVSKKNKIKWMENESIRGKYNNNYRLYVKDKGVIIKIELEDNIVLDESKNILLDGIDFIEKYKEICFNKIGGNFDFYNYLRIRFGWNKNKGWVGFKKDGEVMVDYESGEGWRDREVYDRDFYKGLLMRLMFSKKYLSDSLDDGIIGNINENIFGKNLNEIFYWLKGEVIEIDYNGDKLKKEDIIDPYKNISKILGVIEVDVIEYLVDRYFNKGFYLKIFDGVMIKKSDYWKYRVDVNMILKNEVGYMFSMK